MSDKRAERRRNERAAKKKQNNHNKCAGCGGDISERVLFEIPANVYGE